MHHLHNKTRKYTLRGLMNKQRETVSPARWRARQHQRMTVKNAETNERKQSEIEDEKLDADNNEREEGFQVKGGYRTASERFPRSHHRKDRGERQQPRRADDNNANRVEQTMKSTHLTSTRSAALLSLVVESRCRSSPNSRANASAHLCVERAFASSSTHRELALTFFLVVQNDFPFPHFPNNPTK